MRLFLGKFSNNYPEQIEKKYYAAGDKGSSWYGDVKPGDYVFASYEGKIIGLWKAREYAKMKNIVNPKDEGVLLFDEIKTFNDVSVSNDFTRYKHFIHDLNLVNKVTKSVKGLGFIPIKTTNNCPQPEEIEFNSNNCINIYIALEEMKLDYKEGDIRVTINDIEEMRITSIERYINESFILYDELNNLYEERNREDGKFTIRELNNYALEDNAPNKRKFLLTLIEELEKNGFMKVSNPIRLYDNLLVGRKRSGSMNNISLNNVEKQEGFVDESLEDSKQYEEIASLLNFNPNLILYGPPGTGKTYATQRIIDAYEKKYFNDKSSYKLAELESRVKAITFHQSYSYEEFIEGIRPVLGNDSENIGYRLENGIFKEHSINAEKELIKKKDNYEYVDMINSESEIWKVSLGGRNENTIYDECIKNNDIAVDYNIGDVRDYSQEEIMELLEKDKKFVKKPILHSNTINAIANEMTNGDIIMVYDGPRTVRMIGVVNGDYRYDSSRTSYKHRRSVKWFKDLKYPIDIYKYNGNVKLTLKTIYPLTRMEIPDIVKIVSENSIENQSVKDKHEIKPYYIIIDEINRGNISKIFGELITLIEQDKRGVFRSVLPYSKKEFTVPSNLYIIGTMNTADRSIASIDTALRRRFTFVEIEPDSNIILESDNSKVNDNIDLAKLMDALNNKILEKYDRDHRIGHSYFMGIESLNNLFQTWYFKILPLLGEYFYNDIDTLTSIVGKSFYDRYGNIKYFSLAKKENGLSEFEEKLLEIYKVKNNG
ncbi:MAG TPA: AAA domain-containing protein [Tissierellia bacterium]|nr:AAA domain-containing protein [Tissierellia bacterium]